MHLHHSILSVVHFTLVYIESFDFISISVFFASLLCGLSCLFPVVSEILPDNLVLTYSGIKHHFSIINLSLHPTLPLLPTEIISCLQSLSPLEAISESQTFISPVGGMDCPPLTVCRAISLSIFLSLKVFYTDAICHSSFSGR